MFVSFLLFTALSPGVIASAAAPGPEAIIAQLQKHYESINSIEAEFEQETILGTLNQRRPSEGKMYLKKPALMKWIYTRPDKQEIITDGKALWIYSAADNRAYRYDAGTYLDSQLTMNFFLGRGNFVRDFVFSLMPESERPKGGQYVLKLQPRNPHPHVNEMTLWIDKQSFLIRKIATKDHLGNTTLLSFKKQRINPSLNRNFFSFVPPRGTEIISNDH